MERGVSEAEREGCFKVGTTLMEGSRGKKMVRGVSEDERNG